MIRFNEVTWYSKLGAAILLFGVLPSLSFYIGMRYEQTQQSLEPIEMIEMDREAYGKHKELFFSWSYQSFEEGEFPYTTISLTGRASDGTTETKEVGVVQGNCNDYVSPDVDVYQNSTMIICYYAGFGEYYKVVEQEDGYTVQRKVFEEASPDYMPPQRPFETVARF